MGSGRAASTWRGAAAPLIGAVATAVLLAYRKAMRDLDRSSPADPWSPHRRGF